MASLLFITPAKQVSTLLQAFESLLDHAASLAKAFCCCTVPLKEALSLVSPALPPSVIDSASLASVSSTFVSDAIIVGLLQHLQSEDPAVRILAVRVLHRLFSSHPRPKELVVRHQLHVIIGRVAFEDSSVVARSLAGWVLGAIEGESTL
jgi:hypothetical protein